MARIGWKCECEAENPGFAGYCLHCGSERGKPWAPQDWNAAAESAERILREGSESLSQRYGRIITLDTFGFRTQLTPADARRIVDETEAEILAQLEERMWEVP